MRKGLKRGMFNLLRPLALMMIAGFMFAMLAGCTNDSLEEGQAYSTSVPEDPVVRGMPEADDEPDAVEPTLSVKIDEERDIVALTANRDLDRASVELAIQTTIHDPVLGTSTGYRYGVEWSDDRHALVRFTELRKESAIGFMLDDARTKEGKSLAVVLPEEGRRVVTVYAGAPWSGIRWTNAEGQVVKEQSFDTALLIQPPCCEGGDGTIVVYHPEGAVDRLNPDTGEVTRTEQLDWRDIEASRWSDGSGVGDLHAYAADGESYYIAKGLEHVYLVDSATGDRTLIFRSEDASIYGLASSPDGGKVAVLTDSDRTLGSYADLRIFDAAGEQLFHHEKAAYYGHSDGLHLIYPMAWRDNDSVAVPNTGRSDLRFLRGKLIYDIRKGLIAEEASGGRPEDVVSVLKEAIPGWSGDEFDILRVLPQPGDGAERYYAAHVSGKGTYFIDTAAGAATRIGSGTLLGWSSDGDMLTWYSSEGQYPEVLVLD